MAAETNPLIKVPLPEFVEQIVDRAVDRAVRKVTSDHETRLGKLEKNWAYLVGAVIGSGLVGGTAGGWLSSLFRG